MPNKSKNEPSLYDSQEKGHSSTPPSQHNHPMSLEARDFAEQVDSDQLKYSRYVCDSRAIPNAIDGLKPVQRRILWTMLQSKAKDHFTKTTKVAGMVMAYHPHGNASIEDAIASMVQGHVFANNYPLLEGEGTFGDALDPKAIASARYTEVRLSSFAHDIGLFEELPDISFLPNYDETEKEPVYFCPKLPLILLNPTLGIATGFRCNFPGRKINDVANRLKEKLLTLQKKTLFLSKRFYRTLV